MPSTRITGSWLKAYLSQSNLFASKETSLLSSAYLILRWEVVSSFNAGYEGGSSPCVLEEEAERLRATLDLKVLDSDVLEEGHVAGEGRAEEIMAAATLNKQASMAEALR